IIAYRSGRDVDNVKQRSSSSRCRADVLYYGKLKDVKVICFFSRRFDLKGNLSVSLQTYLSGYRRHTVLPRIYVNRVRNRRPLCEPLVGGVSHSVGKLIRTAQKSSPT